MEGLEERDTGIRQTNWGGDCNNPSEREGKHELVKWQGKWKWAGGGRIDRTVRLLEWGC